ncbi:MAG TPA: glycosyltransferase family 4 protein [Gaiellaceae bacterium]|nr:glycosyltransferase family 4 protein [Gaiellaceae bacterium]
MRVHAPNATSNSLLLAVRRLRAVTGTPAPRPRLLLLSRTRYRLPLDAGTAAKFEALGADLEVHVLATGTGSARGFELHRDSPAFWALLPWRAARALRRVRPDAVLCQTAYEAAAALVARRLAGVRCRVVVEVHGDWRSSTRLYGSPARRLLAPLGDALAAAALRRADGVRTVSPFTSRLVRALGVEPAAEFPAAMELEPFLGPRAPLPAAPTALFVGALEETKGVDVLAAAWPLVGADASLRVIGDGSRSAAVGALGVRWDRARLPTAEIAAALDESWALVLPSRSEGMGRVVVEAFCRGRAVVGTRVGGIADLVEDGVSGLLVPAEDPRALAEALTRVLSDRALAERLGEGAAAAAGRWLQTPEEYARRVRELVA